MDKKNLKRKSLDSPSTSSHKHQSILSAPSSPLGANSNNNNRIFKNNNNNKKKKQRKSTPNTSSTTTTDTATPSELLPNTIKIENITNGDIELKPVDENDDITVKTATNGATTTTTTTTTNTDRPLDPEDDGRLVRVYGDGIFDCFHVGHMKSLQQAKQLFKNTHLIVGVCNDEITHKLKGKTVMNSEERAESVRHCKWVDEVVENAPWVITQEFIDTHKIDYVTHGEDTCLDKDGNDVYQFVKDQGKFRTIKRTEGISTSDIILRIVKDYDSYVMRNLSRGYTGKQMNVGVLKEKSLQFEEKINQIKSRVKTWSDATENNILTFIQRFSKRIPMNLDKSLTSPTLSDSSSGSSNGGNEDDELLSPPTSPKSPNTISSNSINNSIV